MSYATPTELNDYAAARGITLSGDPQQLLTRSQDYLDAQNLVVPDPVPADLVTANIVGAILIDGGADLLAPVGKRVLEESIAGAVSVKYSDQGRTTTAYPQLEALIAPYRPMSTAGFMQIEVTR